MFIYLRSKAPGLAENCAAALVQAYTDVNLAL